MFLAADRPSEPVESVQQLVDYFAAAAKPAAEWRVGTEHEMIGVYADGAAPPFEGERGVAAIFARFAAAGWRPVNEGDNVIALMCSGAQMTFEPGGQLEHAVRPLRHADELVAAMSRNVAIVSDVSTRLGISWLSTGFRPFGTLEDVPWMPKRRYQVMRDYMPTRGAMAHEMMKRTATVQVNLDYSDAEDALEKMRCVMSVTSILTAMYANSPIVDGRLTDYQSYRARVWLDTDPDRCGLLPFVFQDGDVFRGYAEWALDVPLFFVFRGGAYRPAGGMTFRRFMRDGFEGERATMDDWALHLSTLFPEARLKTYIEVRGCDAGSFGAITALGALSRGVLYDAAARRAAIALTAHLSFAERVDLLRAVPTRGLATPVGASGRTAGDLARDLLAIAADGLGRQDGNDLGHLTPLRAIVEERRTQADRAADAYRAAAGNPAALIRELSYPGLGRPAV
jgi:glutamate--cysteine ligase